MPFSNPIAAGNSLARPQFESPNFVPGVSGWAIFRNGNAQFNSLTLTGTTFDGNNYILNTSGFFLYSGTPASGNLVASIAPAAGTDGFGNAYPAGFNLTDLVSGNTISLANGQLAIGNTASGVTAGSLLYSLTTPAAMTLTSPTTAAFNKALHLYLYSQGATGPGLAVIDSPIFYQSPGGAAGAGDGWNSMSTRGYQNGWADNGGATQPGQYRLIGSPPNSMVLRGVLSAGTLVGGTVIINLPTAYRPIGDNQQIMCIPSGAAPAAGMRLELGSNGNLTCQGMPAGVGAVYIPTQIISLD